MLPMTRGHHGRSYKYNCKVQEVEKVTSHFIAFKRIFLHCLKKKLPKLRIYKLKKRKKRNIISVPDLLVRIDGSRRRLGPSRRISESKPDGIDGISLNMINRDRVGGLGDEVRSSRDRLGGRSFGGCVRRLTSKPFTHF